MPQMVDEAGNIWEVDAAGNPVSFVGKQGGQGNTVITKRANPTERRGDDLKNQLTQAQIQKLIADMNKPEKDPNAPDLPKGYMWKNGVVGGDAVLIPGVAAPGANASGKTDKAGAYNSVIAQIDRLYELYNDGIGKTEGIAGILDYLPTETNAVFDTAGAALGDQGNAAFKVPGMGAQSDADAARFVAANQPMASDKDAAALEKLRALRQRLESNMQAVGLPAPQWNYGLDGQPIKQKRDQMAVAGNPGGPQGPDKSSVWLGDAPQPDNGGFAPYGAKYRTQDNPALAGVNVAIGKMIANGASRDQIMAFAASKGVQLDSGTKFGNETPVGRAWMKANPGKPYPVNVDDMTVPMSGVEQFRNNAPQTSLGTAATMAGNAGGMGIPQMLAGGQGLDYLRSQNSGSAFAGDVAGVIGGTSLIGKLGREGAKRLAPQLLSPGKWADRARQIAPDVAYGAIYGGTTEGDPLTGAVTAGLGSLGGQVIGKGLQKTFQGVTDPAVQYLTERGIPLTLGQTLGNRGVIGKTMNKMESLPIVGDMMGARRLDGMKAFEREALRDVVQPVGGNVTEGGTQGLIQAQDAVSQAYRDALSGVNVSPDAQFITDAQAAMQAGAAVPKFGEDFTYAMNQEVGPLFGQTGNLSGPELQSALQSIGKIRSGFGKNPDAMAGYAADATGQMDDALSSLVGRQAPDVMPAYNAAKGAYSRLAPFEKARMGAVNQEAISPAQLARAVTTNTNKFGGRAAAARGDNLTDLMRYGQEVLPSTVPNSGTADRMAGIMPFILPTALGGTAAYSGVQDNPTTAGLLATLAAMSTKTGQKAMQAALTKRPQSAKKLGGIFGGRKSQRAISGAITAPLLIE